MPSPARIGTPHQCRRNITPSHLPFWQVFRLQGFVFRMQASGFRVSEAGIPPRRASRGFREQFRFRAFRADHPSTGTSNGKRTPCPILPFGFTRKVDARLPGKGNSNSHGARPVHLIFTMIKWIRTSRLSIKNSLVWAQALGFRVYG